MGDEATDKEEQAVPEKLIRPGKIDNDDLFLKLFHGVPCTYDDIAGIFGVTPSSVSQKVKRMKLTRELKKPQEFEAELENNILNIMQMSIRNMTADKMDKASLNQLATLFGIFTDKLKQVRSQGMPEVSYVGVVHKFDPKSLAQLKEIMAQETQRRKKESEELAKQKMIEHKAKMEALKSEESD